MTRPEKFRKIAEEITALYEVKDKAYGNSFGSTYEKLGLISAVTRISDKYNRLCNLATNKDIDNLGESIEDTLKDMAAYCIMTLMEMQESSKTKPKVAGNFIIESSEWKEIERVIGRERALKLIENGTSSKVAWEMISCMPSEMLNTEN